MNCSIPSKDSFLTNTEVVAEEDLDEVAEVEVLLQATLLGWAPLERSIFTASCLGLVY